MIIFPEAIQSRRKLMKRFTAVGLALLLMLVTSMTSLRADEAQNKDRSDAIRSSVKKGLQIVQKAANNYPSHRKCFSCHHQTLPMLAMSASREAGLTVDEDIFQQQLKHTRNFFEDRMKNLRSGDGIGGRAMTVGYAGWTLEIAENQPDELSSAMLTYFLKKQEQNGRWRPPSHRPPLEESDLTCTVLAAYTLEKFADEPQQAKIEAALERAKTWLDSAELSSTEDTVMKAWGLHLFGAKRIDVMFAQNAVLKLQRDDGGWGQIPKMESDAYATGQALHILRETGWPTWSPDFQRGVDFLLKTQRDDGSWFVQTRSKPVQVFFDNGDPHGKSQFISIPATSWTVASLAGALKDLSDYPTLSLWPNGVPGAAENEEKPTLTVYTPSKEKANGCAVIVCPGGGYGHLAVGHEGHDIGEWFNSFGVTAFILRYRHSPKYKHPMPMLDVQRAIRFVRSGANKWNLHPNRIGVMGFSAGGHLASTAGTYFDNGNPKATDPIDTASCRPDFMILCYPVISLTTQYTHKGSRRNLLGNDPDPKLVESLSNEKQVTKNTPPTFLFHTSGDTGVPAENSVLFYLALRKAGVPAEMHIYERGRHGLGLATNVPGVFSWTKRCEEWLQIRGYLKGEE
jgi:acetyl esterase/lipase